MEALSKLIDEIRKEVSCCCSWSRYEAVNALLDEMENEMKVEVEITEDERDRLLRDSLMESIEFIRASRDGDPEWQKECEADIAAMKRVYNYYSTPEEHIT